MDCLLIIMQVQLTPPLTSCLLNPMDSSVSTIHYVCSEFGSDGLRSRSREVTEVVRRRVFPILLINVKIIK